MDAGRRQMRGAEAAPISMLQLAVGAARGLLRGEARDRDLPKATLAARHLRLDDAAIGAYGRLCGFETGQGVPLTWPHILAFPMHLRLMMRPDFPFPLAGLVHLHNRIRQHARLTPGETLSLVTGFGRLMTHERGQAFSILTTARRDGDVVWEGESVYLKRGDQGRGSTAPAMRAAAGMAHRQTWRVSADLGRRYAAVSGDANPIHTSALGARLFGFPRAIAHGMWTQARALAVLTPPGGLDAAEIEVSFRSPLLLPGEAALFVTPDRRDFEVRDPANGRVHLRGRLSVLAPSETIV